MGRIRTIKPGFFDDPAMLRLPLAARHAYVWLWTEADDGGRVVLDAYRMKRGCLACDPQTIEDCESYISALVETGRVVEYHRDGNRYGLIAHFPDHQTIRPQNCRPSGSWCPSPLRLVDIASTSTRYAEHVAAILDGCHEKDRTGLRQILWPYPDPMPVASTSRSRRVDVDETSCSRRVDVSPNGGTGERENNDQNKGAGAPDSFALTPPSSVPAPKPEPKSAPKPEPFVLPEWLHAETWAAFVESRKRLRKPMTPHAMALTVKRLDGMRAQGHDPRALLETAIERGWLTVYAPDGGRAPAPASPEPQYRQPLVTAKPKPDPATLVTLEQVQALMAECDAMGVRQ